MKLKQSATTYDNKKYYKRKVWRVCANDVEWIECKHVIKIDAMMILDKQLENLTRNFLKSKKKLKGCHKANQ